MQKIQIQTIFIFILFLKCTNIFSQLPNSHIQLISKTIVGGNGGWDYVYANDEERRIYLSHSTQVEVLDLDTHKKIGVIENTQGVHGICTLPMLKKGFTTNGKTNTVTIFNTKTLKLINEVKVGDKPDGIFYDAYSKQIFILNNEGKTISVINPNTDKVIATIKLAGQPEAGISNGEGKLFINLEDNNTIVEIDAKTFAIKNTFSLAPGINPTGLAYSKATNHLFSACRKNNVLIILDAASGKLINQIPIGKGVDGAVFDATNQIIVTSNGEGNFTVVKEKSKSEYEKLEPVITERGARTIAFDNKTKHFYTITAQFDAPPAATPNQPNPRPAIIPNTFMLLEYGLK